MKKILILILCVLTLSGCLNSMDRQLTRGNKKSETPIINTLKMYENFKNGNDYAPGDPRKPNYWLGLPVGCMIGFCVLLPIWIPFYSIYYTTAYNDYTDLMIPEVKYECLSETSDECILYEREHPRPQTKVDYFNYKKYLPSEYMVDSDEAFLKLVNYYENLRTTCIECDGDGECEMKEKETESCVKVNCDALTTSECKKAKQEYRKEYISNAESKLQWYIKDGMREEKEKAEKEEAERLAEEKAREAKQKAYEKCLKNANLCKDGFKVGCRTDFFDWAKVISVADNGVLVQENSDVVFVYTDIKYTTGSSIRNDNYYEYVGIYNYISVIGSRERVSAYKETNIKIPLCKEP